MGIDRQEKRTPRMSLTDQERICVEKACAYLATKTGGTWEVESYPTEIFPHEKTPEVVVTNGKKTAAIEVKRLTGDAKSRKYLESLLSNEKKLTPPCGGYYILEPPADFRLPMPSGLQTHLKRQIALVAPVLKQEESGVIRVPRQGRIVLGSRKEPSMIFCLHRSQNVELFGPVVSRIRGRYMLIDDGWAHSFMTDDGRGAFQDAIVEACERRLKDGDASVFTWHEEWRLTRGKDAGITEDADSGVFIMTGTEVHNVQDSVRDCVNAALESALAKFSSKRWGDVQMVVLESSTYAPANIVVQAVKASEFHDLARVDYVLLVDNDKLTVCFPQT